MKLFEARCGNLKNITPINWAHYLLMPYLSNAAVIVDATAGNGYDTLFLAQNTNHNAKIYAFDIQENAIESTKKLLLENNFLEKVTLLCDSHIALRKYMQKIDVVIFNLGYLPSGNKLITTNTDITLKAVEIALELLTFSGVLVIVAYPGHHEGKKEFLALQLYLSSLSQKKFTVASVAMANWKNMPPHVFFVKKEFANA